MQERLYELLAISLRYWYVLLIGYNFFISIRSTISLKKVSQDMAGGHGISLFVNILMVFSGLGLLALKDASNMELDVIILAVLVAIIFIVQYLLLRLMFEGIDMHLISVVNMLFCLGIIMLQRLSPTLARNQVEWFGFGIITLLSCLIFTLNIKESRGLLYPLMIAGIVLLVLPLLFGEVIGGAKNWISKELAGREFGFQPSELVKLILIFVFAIEFSEKRNFISRLPVLCFTALSMLILVLSRDLGGALHFFMIFIFIYPIATSDMILTILTAGAAIGSSILSYHLFSHVRVRVEAWKDPWAAIEDKGYQIAHALIAIGSGGLMGSGLGLGIPYIIPASRTDLIFAAICEEMGILVGLLVIGFYAIITTRGIYIAINSETKFDGLLAMGATISLAIQSFIIIGGVIKLIPLTGVTMPFVSYGGSSMVVSLAMIGIIEGVAVKNSRGEEDMEEGDEKI